MKPTTLLGALLLAAPAAAQLGTSTGAASGRAARLAQPAPPTFSWSYLNPSNTGIPGDYVLDIHLDAQDNPYIPGYVPFWEQGGMTHWDGTTYDTISNVDWPVIQSPRFNEIAEDAAGVLWIATDDGLLRYDPAEGPSTMVRFGTDNTAMLSNDLSQVDVAPDGTLWIALDSIGGGTGGLVRHDPAAGTWQQWTTSNGLPWGSEWPGWDDVTFVTVEPTGGGAYTVWFGSSPMGMATYTAGAFSWFGQPGSGPAEKPAWFEGADPIDSSGYMWMMTNGGLARRAPDGTFLTVGYPAGLTTEVSEVVALEGGRAALGTFYSDVFVWDGGWTWLGSWGSGQHTYALAEDSQGRLWAGGIGGAARWENGAWQRYRLTNTGMLGYFMQAIAFAPNGDVYVNGNAAPGVGGFSFTDGQDWTCCNDANYGLGPPWGMPSDDVQALAVLPNGNLLFTPTFQGIWEWDGALGFTQHVAFADVRRLVVDGLGRGWGATASGALYLVDGVQVTTFTVASSPLYAGSIGSLVPDPQQPGYVWVCSQFGVAHTDGTTWNLYPRELVGLTQNTTSELLTCAEPDVDGSLWMGTPGNGVFRLELAGGAYQQFTPANSGLPSDDVSNLELAPDGSLWLTTFDFTWPYPGGLTRWDGVDWQTWQAGSSPHLHNQVEVLESRGTAGSYELWIGYASEGVAVVTVE